MHIHESPKTCNRWEVNEVVGHFGGLWHPIAHEGVADSLAVTNLKGSLVHGISEV